MHFSETWDVGSD